MCKGREIFIVAGALVLAGIVAGCASILTGTAHNLSVNSAPSATVVVNRVSAGLEGMKVYEGVTPAQIKLSKKYEYMVTISAQGYKQIKVPVTQDGIEGMFFLNFVCGGLIGFVVDYVDGAMYKMEPESISVTLQVASLPGQPANRLYAVFRTPDRNGDVHAFAVPMIRTTVSN